MKQITYVNNSIVFGATTLKDTSVPENNNMALHVCLDQKKVMISLCVSHVKFFHI